MLRIALFGRVSVVFIALLLASAVVANAAYIDPYKGRWRVDMVRTLQNFRQNLPDHVPKGGFPDVLLKSMKTMTLEIKRRRFVFRLGKRKVINSRFKTVVVLEEGIIIRITARKKKREQFLGLLPDGALRVFALVKGKPDPRASANHYFWKRVGKK